jgi:homoserine dehydrogenase
LKSYAVCMMGFGNVGKAFAKLMTEKSTALASQYDFSLKVTGIATASHGRAMDHKGLDLEKAVRLVREGKTLDSLSTSTPVQDNFEFIRTCQADILLENTPVNHSTGQPAIDHLRCALESGMHAITANKGAVVHGYSILSKTAQEKGKRFLFESAVMDGAPVFSLFREPLPVIGIRGFHGILNSCTNFILGLMENGKTLEEAILEGQNIGITETDPSADVDGWDAAIKVAALCTVLMNRPLVPQEVDRTGIRAISHQMIADARVNNQRWKLVCRAGTKGNSFFATVKPERVTSDSVLFAINGTSSYVEFETDVLPGLGIVESNPGPNTTAYGLLSDLVNAVM